MKKNILPLALSVAAVVFSPLRADAQSTYTTTNGTVNLIAGLTSLSSFTAINDITNQAAGITYITDNSWSTGIINLGNATDASPNNGTLAGTFVGGTFFGTNNGIILIGVSTLSGSWTIRLLLSDDTYSSASNFSMNDVVLNSAVLTAPDPDTVFFNNAPGQWDAGEIVFPGAVPTFYQELDIAAFDTNNIGFKGIELSNMGAAYPDLTYIGVTGVPEPSTYALLALSAASLGGYVLRRRQK